VGTTTQRARMTEEGDRRGVSLAEIVREAIDDRYGLVDGEEPVNAVPDPGI